MIVAPPKEMSWPQPCSTFTDSLRSVNDCILLKYADDIAVCSPVERILGDATHPLYEPMVSLRSMRPPRRAFRFAPVRTETYRRSVLPSLHRFLIEPNSVRNELLHNLLQN